MSEFYYFIGDIHGMYDQLIGLIDLIESHHVKNGSKSSKIIFLGDYVDRGPDTKKVINFLSNYNKIPTVFLKGNHDQYFIDTYGYNVNINENDDDFIYSGCIQTLESFNYDANELQNAAEWLKENCYSYFQVLNLVGVHAGIDWSLTMKNQKESTLLYTRENFLKVNNPDYPFRIIHGHTITKSREVEIFDHRIAVDSGAFLTGKLSCVVMKKEQLTTIVDDVFSYQSDNAANYMRMINACERFN